MTTPVVSIAGWKNSGKTSLVERLVSELAQRGLRVATVKHAHHDFDVDIPGTDSFRHRHAGAQEVAIVSARRWAVMHELRDEAEPTLEEIVARMSPADIVIVEGWKRGSHPKIELRRKDAGSDEPLAPGDPSIFAIVTDDETNVGNLPVFSPQNIKAITDFLIATFNLEASG